MAWKKAYPAKVVKNLVAMLKKQHKIQISQSEIEDAIQNCKNSEDLAKQLNKKFKNAKVADLKKTLGECGF